MSARDYYILTKKSGNRKTGPIPVSMSTQATCPTSCLFKKGCYANFGRLSLSWRKLGKGELTNGVRWEVFLDRVRDLRCDIWRHNQAGDLPGRGNKLDRERCLALVEANAHGYNRGGYTYTHYPVLPAPRVRKDTIEHNRAVVYAMNKMGFVVNLSAHSVESADALCDLGIGPVVTVLPIDGTSTKTPKGRRVVVCPALTKDGVTCTTCFLCAKTTRPIIGFPAHGSGQRRVDQIARGKLNPYCE